LEGEVDRRHSGSLGAPPARRRARRWSRHSELD
jgi:hypothetical protein